MHFDAQREGNLIISIVCFLVQSALKENQKSALVLKSLNGASAEHLNMALDIL